MAQKYLGLNDPDYYEWETHIFFDDAFKKGPADAPGDKPVIYLDYNYVFIFHREFTHLIIITVLNSICYIKRSISTSNP